MSHIYVPTNWVNKKTQLNADNMNKIEQELARLAKESGGISEVKEGPGIIVTPGEGSVIVGLRSGSSQDNLLVLDKDEGLLLTLDLGYDPETRELVLSSGSGWRTSVQFDIDKVIVDGNYDPETRNIVLTLSDDTEIIIDMSKLKINWKMLESNTISIEEGVDEDGIQTFKLNAKISKKEKNSITEETDGLYSERLEWNNLGVSDESDGRWEFEEVIGNKYWFFESSKSVQVDKFTENSDNETSVIDYYNFGYRISTDEGNILEIRNGKLYSPNDTPENAIIRQEIQRLEEEYQALKDVKFRTSKSVRLNEVTDPDTGEIILSADVRISTYPGNEILILSDGIRVPPYEPDPDMPDLTPYINRLEELEKEYPRSKKEVDYIKTSINI